MATKKKEVMEVEENKEVAQVKTGTVHDCILLNVRANPNMEAKVLGTVEVNDKCEVLEELNKIGWVKVKFNRTGLEGFCVANFIKID